ncbi:MAG TPA: SOS response-associated peptidase [Kofleriaceae bacterium]|nr:SOS response-associated peptidase [Kofleriaceae bacterium]
MCGRYPSTRQAPLIEELELSIVGPAELEGILAIAPAMPKGLASWWAPRWNVAPTQPVRAIVARDGGPRLTLARWGLTPPPKGGKRPPIINARAESAPGSGLFRGPLARGRCLVVADGFYEWRGAGKARVPVRYAPAGAADDGRAITLAAIARRREHDGRPLDELAILTTAADALVAPVHDRRPVVIAAADRTRWLDADLPAEAVADLLAAAPLAGWTATDAPVWLNAATVEHDAAPRDLFG